MTKDRAYPSRTADQFVVRFPDGMRNEISEAAVTNGRSMNTEIVHRLRQTFQPIAPTIDYPEEVVIAVQDEMDERGGTFAEALARLVLAGYSGGGTLLTIKAARKTSYGAILQALDTSKTVVPPNTRVLFARDRRPTDETPPTDEKNRAQGPA